MKFIFILIVIAVAFVMGHIYGDLILNSELTKNLPTVSIDTAPDNS